MRDAGSAVHYHAVDVADRASLSRVVDVIRAGGPIDGLIHGAGIELAKALEKKSDEIFELTVRGKLDGLVYLLELTESDPLTHVIGFSSVSGRFGGHGQTDYSLANEALARTLGCHRQSHPGRRVSVISWPAFSEVGLAARSSARTFLENAGQSFMSPDEGANHLVRELWAGLDEPEVTLARDAEALDLDHLLPRGADRDGTRRLSDVARASPLLGRAILHRTGRTIFERSIRPTEPFLDQHRLDGVPILPAVIQLEMLTEAANAGGGEWAVESFHIQQPLKVQDKRSNAVHIERAGDELFLRATSSRPDGVVLEPLRLHATARCVPFAAGALGEMSAAVLAGARAPAGDPLPYPYMDSGSVGVYHGPVLRTVESVRSGPDGGTARLIAKPVAALVSGSSVGAWHTPAALLDGCLQAVGMLGRILYQITALPRAMRRIAIDPGASSLDGSACELTVRFRKHDSDLLVADFTVTHRETPIIAVEGYEAGALHG
jgi:NAD(P)-dependent dehydrogenase (short-subunit alcohol dehydrogenase family)